jgi:hypothetical protein
MRCQQCGAEMERKRSTKRFCSSSCRVLAFYGRRLGLSATAAVNRTVRQTPEIPRTAREIPTVEKTPALEVPATASLSQSPEPPRPELAPVRVESTTTDPAPRQVEPAPVLRVEATTSTPEALERARRLIGYRGALYREGIEALLARRLAARHLSPEAKLRFQAAAEVLLAALEVRRVG